MPWVHQIEQDLVDLDPALTVLPKQNQGDRLDLRQRDTLDELELSPMVLKVRSLQPPE